MDFIFLQLWLKVFMVTNMLCTVTGDMSVDVAFSLLNDRLDNLAIKVYAIENELKTSVASINNRIDTMEMTYDSVLKHNPTEKADQVASDKHDLSYQIATSRREHNVVHALKTEKVFIRKSLDAFERKFAVFQSTVTDNVNAMNETIEQLKLQSGEKLEEFVSEQNEFKNQMTIKSNQAVEEINAQVREALQNATMERELFINTMESAISNVNTTAMSTSKWIKQELDTEIKNQVTSIIQDNTVTLECLVMFGSTNRKLIYYDCDGSTYNGDNGVRLKIPKSGVYLIHLSPSNIKDTFELHAGLERYTGGVQTRVVHLRYDYEVYVKLLKPSDTDLDRFVALHFYIVLLSFNQEFQF